MIDPLERFLDIAGKNPTSEAIHTEKAVWTYSELERHVRAFAAIFAKKNAPRVAIALPQQNSAYAAFLGVGLAGGFYTPMNIEAPIDKLQRIISELQPDFIVAEGGLRDILGNAYPDASLVDPVSIDLSKKFEGIGKLHEYAHVVFTSGSTGMPKGVINSRRGLTNYVDSLECYKITNQDRIAQQPNLAFDFAMIGMYAALCFGGTLYPLAEFHEKMMPGRFIMNNKITVWHSTPSSITQMMRGKQLNSDTFGTVRLASLGGEHLFAEHVEAIFAASPTATVHNIYGPTEGTIAVTYAEMNKENYKDFCHNSISIGKAQPGVDIVLVDGPTLDEGEAVIFGPQLAVGYWRDPEKTATAFININGRRGYRTGDWMVRIAGQLYFKERIDFQVKVQGYRIELDEVMAAICRIGWNVAVVFKQGDRLAAVIEQEPDKEFDPRQMRKDLAKYIEKYAIPDRFIVVKHIPRNANDKLDRKAAEEMFEKQIGLISV